MVIVHQVYITEVGYASDRLLTVMGPMLMVLDCSNRGGELRISPQNRSCLCTATWAAMRPPYTLQKRQNDINNARKMRYIIMGQVCAAVCFLTKGFPYLIIHPSIMELLWLTCST